MPCATRPERLALILCGGAQAPDADLLQLTRARVELAGFALALPQAKHGPGEPSQVPDAEPEASGLGPLGGIAAAVADLETQDGTCLLIVPADMPQLNPRALQRLADIAEADGRGALFDLGPLPMALIVKPALREALRLALHCPPGRPEGRSLIALTERLGLPVVASLPDDGLDNLVIRRDARRINPEIVNP